MSLKYVISFVVLILIALPSLNADDSKFSPYNAYVSSSKLNIREKPFSNSKILVKLNIGNKVSIVERMDKWVQISFPEQKISGWTLGRYLYHSPPDLQKILYSYETTPKFHLLTRKMWAERAMALDESEPKAQRYFNAVTTEIRALNSPPKLTKEELKFKDHQWVYSKSYRSGMSYAKLSPGMVDVSTDKLNVHGLGTVNANVSASDNLTNLVMYDFDKDGIDEIVVVGKYWSCVVKKQGCDSKPTQKYVLMVLKRELVLTDMHRWSSWKVIEQRTDYVVRSVFVTKTRKGVRVVTAENSAQCDMDRMDDYTLMWDSTKKKIVTDDPAKTSLFNLGGNGDCGE